MEKEIKQRIVETLRDKMEANGDGFLQAAATYALFRQFELLERIESRLASLDAVLVNGFEVIDATLEIVSSDEND